jgi:hypothetical protein
MITGGGVSIWPGFEGAKLKKKIGRGKTKKKLVVKFLFYYYYYYFCRKIIFWKTLELERAWVSSTPANHPFRPSYVICSNEIRKHVDTLYNQLYQVKCISRWTATSNPHHLKIHVNKNVRSINKLLNLI